ncbi:cation:dicarboxylate symporter family transporter [Colwellia psychrerythraea]|uniref:Sodium:dicarboxylate symporter n=1 Tax=Colwellia psychrerythraea TaxID=28229 RepID=A0A099KQ21_COLPS|nr:cation:dicarboxylase symporter family transporter [Colwellia psychrerythraea]KGJ92869.1 sodium:dicarboxylate symporter [Colwellia psychrerythraea]
MNKIPLSVSIILAMLIGLTLGTLSGTVYTGVEELANAFVMLLQMTALPYIALSLIVGIGGLNPEKVTKTLKLSLFILITLLAIVLAFILLAPIAFPDWQSADFYSINTINTTPEFDIISLFIPTNPFYALANGLIPSVVLFSIFIGIGLMKVKAKKTTLSVLNGLNNAVVNVSNMVMRFAPIGIFCIALRAAATVDSSQLDGLQVYIVTAAVLVFLLSFIVLPAIVAIITPFSYRQILASSRQAMITAFATGSFFVVIPIIVEKAKQLIEQIPSAENGSKSVKADASNMPSIIVPICFSLPVGGKLLAILFALFAAWFSGSQVNSSDYLQLLVAGIPQLFGSTTIAIPSLLELFNVPGSLFDLFLVAENIIVGRLNALLSVIFSISLVLLIATSMLRKFTFKWRSFSGYLLLLPIISIVAFLALRFTFDAISYQYQGYEKFIERDFIVLDGKAKVLTEPDLSGKEDLINVGVLDRIKQRGFIRVGYFRDDLPYTFHNQKGKLVGFDIEIINLLADDLGVSIEFVRIFHKQAKKLLSSGYLDMTTGVPVTPKNMKEYTLTVPYSSQSMAFLVKEERRKEFNDWQSIFSRDDLIIGIPEIFHSENIVRRYFEKATVWEISTPRLFFREKYQHIDAMLFGAATASAWTLINPEYTVIVPKPARPEISMAFAINTSDNTFEIFMRNWIFMMKKNQNIDQLFHYWIAGKKPKSLLKKDNNQENSHDSKTN